MSSPTERYLFDENIQEFKNLSLMDVFIHGLWVNTREYRSSKTVGVVEQLVLADSRNI
jgi:hypothetical protein